MSLKPVGINFHGYGSAAYQNRCTPLPPSNYVEDSFRIFADSKIVCIRVTFHWESWELNPDLCCEDLKEIAESADKYGLMCIYDVYPYNYLEMIDNTFGIEENTIEVCSRSVKGSKESPLTKISNDFLTLLHPCLSKYLSKRL